MNFGKRLRYVMIDHDITSAQLSRATGISPPNVCHMLAGRKQPAFATLSRVVAALPAEVNIRELILGKENRHVNKK